MSVDDIFAASIKETAQRLGKPVLDDDLLLFGLKLPSFSTRFLFQNEGLLFGKIIHLVGEEASFKSTFSSEILRWHLENGGAGIVFDTELRPISDIYSNFERKFEKRFHRFPCSYLEDWESALLSNTRNLLEADKKFPCCFVVDSVLGCNSKDTTQAIFKDGFASSRFSLEAKSISDFLRSYTHLLYNSLFTVCFVNHRKFRSVLGSNVPVKSSLGGTEIRFYSSYEFELSKERQTKDFSNSVFYDVIFDVYKNTYGMERLKFRCPVVFTKEGNSVDVKFLWHTATAQLLGKLTGIKPPLSVSHAKRVREICNVGVKFAGRKGELYWCAQVGINEDNAVSAEEFGLALEEHSQILDELYKLFNISKRYIYNPQLSFEENKKAYFEWKAQN